jgi:hypothetical protein
VNAQREVPSACLGWIFNREDKPKAVNSGASDGMELRRVLG